MKKRCDEYWEGLVRLAEGAESAEAREHVRSCPACEHRLAQVTEIFHASRVGFFDAPRSLVESVEALYPQPRVAPLIRSSLAWTGARAIAEDFQLVVGEGLEQVRLMFVKVGGLWEVMGKVPGLNWSAERDGEPLELDASGRFSFGVEKLSDSAFVLSGPHGRIFVPSAEEYLSRGPERSG